MSMDRGWTASALEHDASRAAKSERSTGAPGVADLALLGVVQLIWIAAVIYGAYRALEIIGQLS